MTTDQFQDVKAGSGQIRQGDVEEAAGRIPEIYVSIDEPSPYRDCRRCASLCPNPRLEGKIIRETRWQDGVVVVGWCERLDGQSFCIVVARYVSLGGDGLH